MAILAPLIGGVAGALGLGGAAASLAGSLLAGAIGIGASLIYAASQRKNASSETVAGAEQDLVLGGDVPRQIVFGDAAVSGHLVEVIAWGASNAIECEVIALADWECDSLIGIIVDGEAKTLVPQATIGGEDARFFVNDADNGNLDPTDDAKHYGAKLEIRFYRGAPTQTADAELIANSGGRWTSDHRGDGICYVVVRKTYDADLFSGFPTYKFILRGAKLWDPRMDESVGGSGTHDWSDPATWSHVADPATCLLNWQRGFWRGGSLFMGLGVPVVDLPLDAYVAAANICDEIVETATGVEPRYRVSAIAVEGSEHRVVMESFVGAMAGALYEQGGMFIPVCGAARSISATITDGDFLRDAPIKVSHKRTRADLLNYVSGSFTSPADLWSSKGYTPRSSASDEATDQGRLAGSVDLPQVTSQWQSERVAEIRRRESRHQVRASGVVGLHRFGLTIGDWVRWNSARHGDRTYVVKGWSLALAGDKIGVALALDEISADVYSSGEPSAALPVVVLPSAPAFTRSVAGFAISPTTVSGPTGEAMPAAVATWSPPTDATVTAIVIEYRRTGADRAFTARSDTPERGSMIIAGLVGGADYEARATIVTDPPRATAWTVWMSFATDTGSLGSGMVDFAQFVPSLSAQIDSIASTVDGVNAAMLRETLARVADRRRAWSIGARVQTTVTEAWTAGVSAVSSRLDTVEAVITDDIGAAIAQEATARATEDSALADLIATVEADVGAASAAIGTEASVRATADSALAADVEALAATVGDASASGGIKFAVAADQTGALARYELWLKATSGAFSGSAAMTLEVLASGATTYSQIKFTAGRLLVVGDDGSSVVPFSVVGGATYIDTLQVRHSINIGAGGGGEILIWGT